MNDSHKFEKYQIIKEQIKYNYNGYPIEKILALDLIVQVYFNRSHTIKSYISYIVKHTIPIFFSSLNLNGLRIDKPSSTLFSMGMYKRKDYYEIWEYVKSNVSSHFSFDFSVQKKRFKLNFRNILRSILIMYNIKELSGLSKLFLAAKITHYFNVIDDLEKIAPIAGKYCSFSSIHEHETVLTCYFKKHGVKTYSIQHGLYAIFKSQIPVDAILYENFVSDFHLCWGQFTKDEFISYGINEHSLIIGGYPRMINRPAIPDKLNKKECLVLLARYSYHKTNLKLIEVLEKFAKKHSVNISLKLHPTLHVDKYQSYYESIAKENNWTLIPKSTTITKLLQNNQFGWSVSVNTGAYYESYIYNLPCLRYNDGSFEDTLDIADDKFSNISELKNSLNNIPFYNSNDLANYFDEVKNRLDYAIGINKNEYHLLEC